MPCVALLHDDAAPFGSLFVFTSPFGCAISTWPANTALLCSLWYLLIVSQVSSPVSTKQIV